MRRIIVPVALLMVLCCGCAGKSADAENRMAEWESTANLEAEETAEQLYAAALEEETLVVYSTSTRMMDVAKSFEKQYPGLTVKVEDIREGELFERLEGSFEDESYECDVVCSADGRGIIQNEFLQKGIVYKYMPYDIEEHIMPDMYGDLLMLAGESVLLCYNDVYYDEPPVGNWWELTEEQWRGKVYMPNPMRSVTTSVFLNMLIKHSDEMAAAYEEYYGEPLVLADGVNAGEEFISRLVANDVNVVNASDEVVEAISAPGVETECLGIMISSKLRVRAIGYNVQYIEKLTPFCGISIPTNIMVAGGARNVNAAKLFIRWILGEADGQGEGYKPYLQGGSWSVRDDVKGDPEMDLDAMNQIFVDRNYTYQNREALEAFWVGLVLESE